MTLPLPWQNVKDPEVQENFSVLAQQFPVSGSAAFSNNYRAVAQAATRMNGGFAAGFYLPQVDGTNVLNTANANIPPPAFHIDPADYASSGTTVKYRLRVLSNVNSTAPGISYTFGWHSLTSITGAAGVLNYTFNPTAVTGSTTTLSTPSSSTGNLSVSSQFTATSGFYGFGITTSGVAAGNSTVHHTLLLQVVNV